MFASGILVVFWKIFKVTRSKEKNRKAFQCKKNNSKSFIVVALGFRIAITLKAAIIEEHFSYR